MEPKKVLIVDDSKLMHRMYEVMLREYYLLGAFDGREALDLLQENSDVELVLLDINMPNMNGLEFLAEYKTRDDLVRIPVVVISTEGKDEDAQRGLEAGATEYIRKPFQSEEIREVVSRLTEGSAA